jgi:hypothetical protein
MTIDSSPDRRDYQRLLLDEPVDGLLGVRQVRVADLTVSSAGLIYAGPEIDQGVCSHLAMTWLGDTIEVACQVRRTTPLKGALAGWFSSGVVFQRSTPETIARVRNLMLLTATEQLGRRRIELAADTGFAVDSGTTALRAPYIAMRLVDDVWDRRRTFSARQPRDGFTVLAGIREMELQRLCATFRMADVPSRQLMRVLAELAIAEAVGGVEMRARIAAASAVF